MTVYGLAMSIYTSLRQAIAIEQDLLTEMQSVSAQNAKLQAAVEQIAATQIQQGAVLKMILDAVSAHPGVKIQMTLGTPQSQ